MLIFIQSINSIISKADTSLIIRMSVVLIVISFIEFIGLAMISFLMINIGSMDTIAERFELLNYLNIRSDVLPLVLSLFICAYALISISISISFLKFVSLHSQLIAGRIKLRLINYYLSLGWMDHIKNTNAEKISRILNDATHVGQQILFAMHLFSRFALALIISAALLYYNPIMTSIMVLSLALSYFTIYIFFKPAIARNSIIVASEKDLALKTLTNMFGSMKEIIFYNTKDKVLKDFDGINEKIAAAEGVNMYLAQIPRFIIDSLLLIALVLFAAFFSTQGITANNFIVTVSVYGVAGLKLLPAFQNIFYFASEIHARSKYLNNIVPLIGEIQSFDSDRCIAESYSLSQAIQFQNVSFSYLVDSKKAVSNLNISINSGKKIAIIGPSGSGKSTFLDLLLGFISPDSGQLIVDGKTLEDDDLVAYRKSFSYVPQKLYLLETSLKENIIFGSIASQDSESTLLNALHSSYVNNFINDLPDGIHTLLSDSNLSLSGGQKQSVGIARALYNGGEILLLDEATSAMDSELEENIMHEIIASNFKTIIAITHKPSMLKYFDEIFVFNDGMIESHGTYEDLKQTNNFLNKMIEISDMRDDEI
ncbi:ABC transporter ATP-binding protein/permease [bacterium]|nr:ABC transporter ATP-binding protein/permease [bacterium]